MQIFLQSFLKVKKLRICFQSGALSKTFFTRHRRCQCFWKVQTPVELFFVHKSCAFSGSARTACLGHGHWWCKTQNSTKVFRVKKPWEIREELGSFWSATDLYKIDLKWMLRYRGYVVNAKVLRHLEANSHWYWSPDFLFQNIKDVFFMWVKQCHLHHPPEKSP